FWFTLLKQTHKGLSYAQGKATALTQIRRARVNGNPPKNNRFEKYNFLVRYRIFCMKTSKFSEIQITAILKQAEVGNLHQ
ncbi:MAG TPA: hypothetical protein PK212_05185, partial [Agitococcus sp.]|nr:hypothetical protein [Agitococcus sp.]HNG10521.1 hypothetical protein [Agitococcus sp.]HNG46993.1 hypothetical protein [Agitococcus sp.]